MALPFTRDQFFEVFSDYNETLWPFVLLLWISTVVALVALVRHRPFAQTSIKALLIIHWMWSAIAYHAAFFSRINPAAWLFSALFLVQAAMLWRHSARMQFGFLQGWSVGKAFSAMFVVYALIYPALVWLDGHVFPRGPAFAVPCPTTILTIGLLMGAARPLPQVTAIIPIIWSVIGGSAAVLFGVTADLMLLAAGAGLLIHIGVLQRRSAAEASDDSTRILQKPHST
jgi:hypothetical protein